MPPLSSALWVTIAAGLVTEHMSAGLYTGIVSKYLSVCWTWNKFTQLGEFQGRYFVLNKNDKEHWEQGEANLVLYISADLGRCQSTMGPEK